MIEVEGLTKRYGATTAVDDLSFTARPGAITGFLGPNGAGKTTALKVIVGLARRQRGPRPGHAAAWAPRSSRAAPIPAAARAPTCARSPRSAAIARARVDEVLALAGLEHAAKRRVGTFSLGMRQRLGLAAALLEDPPVLVLDEPVNGLDPQGIRWLRTLLRDLAAEGRTILLSSHMLSEAATDDRRRDRDQPGPAGPAGGAGRARRLARGPLLRGDGMSRLLQAASCASS